MPMMFHEVAAVQISNDHNETIMSLTSNVTMPIVPFQTMKSVMRSMTC